MANDKLVDSTQLDADLTSVANAIRTKGGTSADLDFPADFVSAIAAIPSGGGNVQYATGSYTPTQDYTTEDNVKITDTDTIGFTPKLFLFFVDKVADVSGVSGAMLETLYHNNGSSNHYRTTVRYSNTSNTRQAHTVGTSWTTQTSFYLYLHDGNIYYRIYYSSSTGTKSILKANVKYDWIAFAW